MKKKERERSYWIVQFDINLNFLKFNQRVVEQFKKNQLIRSLVILFWSWHFFISLLQSSSKKNQRNLKSYVERSIKWWTCLVYWVKNKNGRIKPDWCSNDTALWRPSRTTERSEQGPHVTVVEVYCVLLIIKVICCSCCCCVTRPACFIVRPISDHRIWKPTYTLNLTWTHL